MAPEENGGYDQCANESAVEIAGAREHGQREYFGRRRSVLREVSHDHQRLCTDDGAADRPESEDESASTSSVWRRP